MAEPKLEWKKDFYTVRKGEERFKCEYGVIHKLEEGEKWRFEVGGVNYVMKSLDATPEAAKMAFERRLRNYAKEILEKLGDA